jgi:hypothetical protein
MPAVLYRRLCLCWRFLRNGLFRFRLRFRRCRPRLTIIPVNVILKRAIERLPLLFCDGVPIIRRRLKPLEEFLKRFRRE